MNYRSLPETFDMAGSYPYCSFSYPVFGSDCVQLYIFSRETPVSFSTIAIIQQQLCKTHLAAKKVTEIA